MANDSLVTKRSDRGFSLVEMLIVVAIIVILAAVALPNIGQYIRNYKIKGAAQEVAGELQTARSRAIMIEHERRRLVRRRRRRQLPLRPGGPDRRARSSVPLKDLPLGVRFVVAAAANSGTSLRFSAWAGSATPRRGGSCGAAVADALLGRRRRRPLQPRGGQRATSRPRPVAGGMVITLLEEGTGLLRHGAHRPGRPRAAPAVREPGHERHDPRNGSARGAEAGFTLVEALVAIVVLIFGLMAVTNLMLVAASSNSVANQGTAAVTSATRAMDMLKATTFDGPGRRPAAATTFATTDGAKACDDPDPRGRPTGTATTTVPGVGTRPHALVRHRHRRPAPAPHPRPVRGDGRPDAARARAPSSRRFRACTNSDPADRGRMPGGPMTTPDERGFSLVELMVAMTVTLIVSGAIYGLLTSGRQRLPARARAGGPPAEHPAGDGPHLARRLRRRGGAAHLLPGLHARPTPAGACADRGPERLRRRGRDGRRRRRPARGGDGGDPSENTDVLEIVTDRRAVPGADASAARQSSRGTAGVFVTREGVPALPAPARASCCSPTTPRSWSSPPRRSAARHASVAERRRAARTATSTSAAGLLPWAAAASPPRARTAAARRRPVVFLYRGEGRALPDRARAPTRWTPRPPCGGARRGRYDADGAVADEPGDGGFTPRPARPGSSWRGASRTSRSSTSRRACRRRVWRLTTSRRSSVDERLDDARAPGAHHACPRGRPRPNLQGETAGAGGAPDAVRGQLSTDVAPRAAFNELQMGSQDPMRGTSAWKTGVAGRRARGAGLRPRPRHPLPDAADVPGADAGHHHVHRAPDRHQLPLEPAGALQRRGGARGGAHRAEQRRPTSTHAVADPAARRRARRPWAAGAAPRPAGTAVGPRLLRGRLRHRGAGVGYGRVLDGRHDTRYENVSAFAGQTLNGAFTVWIRRALLVTTTPGSTRTTRRNDALVIVAEGVAPYSGAERRLHARAPGRARPRDALQPRARHGRRALASASAGPGGRARPWARTSTPARPSPRAPAGTLANAFGGARSRQPRPPRASSRGSAMSRKRSSSASGRQGREAP